MFSKCAHSIQLHFLPSCPSHFPHCFVFLVPLVFFLFPWHLPLNNTGTDHQIRCKAQNEQWFLWLYQKTYKLVEWELTTPLNIHLRVFVSFIIIWMPQAITAMSKGWHMVCLRSYKLEYVQSQEFIFKTSPTLQTVMKWIFQDYLFSVSIDFDKDFNLRSHIKTKQWKCISSTWWINWLMESSLFSCTHISISVEQW